MPTKKTTNNKPLNLTPRLTRSMSVSQSMESSSTPKLSNSELRNLVDSLQEQVSSLSATVGTLENKVNHLEGKLTSCMSELDQAKATQAIAQIASGILRDEVDRLQQYSRRNCIVVEGMKASINDTPESHLTKIKTLLSNEFPEDADIMSSLDKTHPIGPIIRNKQKKVV